MSVGPLPDLVGCRVIEALARRAAAQQGPARTLLLRRVAEMQAVQAAQPGPAPGVAVPDATAARQQVLAGLSDLIDRLGRAPAALRPAARGAALPPQAPAPASLRSVTAYQRTWSRLRAEQRLRQALAQVPAMAGPLNSARLVNRALEAMRDLSPAYLEAFMLHIDTLLWLEQASGAADAAARPAAEVRRRPAAGVARKA